MDMKVETLLYRLTLVSGGLIAGLSSAEQGDFSRMNTGIDLPSAHSQSVMIFEYENRHQVTPELPKVFARSYPQEIARSGGTSNSTKSSHVACVGSGCRINNSYSRKSSINSPTGIKDIIFANSFEGFSILGGTTAVPLIRTSAEMSPEGSADRRFSCAATGRLGGARKGSFAIA